MFSSKVIARFTSEFGAPERTTKKVTAFGVGASLGIVVQTDQPVGGEVAFVWLPYRKGAASVPENALVYPAESGRHSNTYPSAGLERGEPALKLTLRSTTELEDAIAYVRSLQKWS